jgi:glycogen debranching enzyme
MTRAVPQPLQILFGGGVTLACGDDGQLQAEELHGLFAADTRVLSTYQMGLCGHRWQVLSRVRTGPSTAQWELQNPFIRTISDEIPAGCIHCRMRRRLDGALHECFELRLYGRRPVAVRLMWQLDADFADLFEVKAREVRPRLNAQRFPTDEGVTLLYQRRGFERGLRVIFEEPRAAISHVGTHALFDVELQPGRPWSMCLEARPVVDGRVLRFGPEPHGADEIELRERRLELRADPLLAVPFRQSRADLERLTVGTDAEPYVAAGAPWFLTLFGRDPLVTSLMTGLLGTRTAVGAMAALAALQATERDDFRDAEPGKLPHERRQGELARFGEIPHTPYYGTHDAPALFVLTLWHAWRWSGETALLERFLPAARRCLAWCVEAGDRDGDGLLEYGTRSPRGYYNQAWKDAGDAILHADGARCSLPIATVELQGYWFAALLAMAELLDARDEGSSAAELRRQAAALRARVEERFWLEQLGCYALALDGAKRPAASVSSNPGHLLLCGLPSPERARRLGARLLRADMTSGYGLRTLSSEHAAYNPLSYQLGSVWPHDTALVAAGLFRYGLRAEGARLLHDLLQAAAAFEHARLPELFCGFDADGAPPVPYGQANSPQAWAAAAPILAAQLFAGLVPEAPRRRCWLDPWLPEWLSRMELRGIPIADTRIDLVLERQQGRTRLVAAEGRGIELVEGSPVAPLWGSVPS